MAQSRIGRPGQFDEFRRHCIQRVEQASLHATDRAAREGLSRIRAAFQAAGLGRLGFALGYGSDLKKNGRVHRRGAEGYSASGWIYIRSGSDRAVGAIESYTEGSTIVPVKGRWLWIATDRIPARAGRQRMTPQRYIQGGYESRIGPLQFVPGRHAGEGLLVVKDATDDRFGRPGKLRRVPRRGGIGASRERVRNVVAFVGIRVTQRSQRVDVQQILSLVQTMLPVLREEALRRGGSER